MDPASATSTARSDPVPDLASALSNRTAAPVASPDSSPAIHGVSVAAQALLLLAIFLLSSLGNLAVVVVIVKHRQLRTVTNAFILSLSTSDFLTAALCLPLSFAGLFHRGATWPFGDGLCVANGFFNTCLGIISTLTMTLISFDRYYAIVRRPQEKIGRSRAAQLLLAVWLTAVLISTPWHLLLPLSSHAPDQPLARDSYRCTYSFGPGGFGVTLIVVGYLLPFALMCFCHYNICRTVRLSAIRVRPVTTYAHLLRFYSEMRTATTVLIMIVFIILCWGPYCLLGLVSAAGGPGLSPNLDSVATWMAWANGAINPLIYVIRNPNISALLGRGRREGYRTRDVAAYVSAQSRGYRARNHAERPHERHAGRATGSQVSSCSPADGCETAVWACKNPAVLFCRDARAGGTCEAVIAKAETADTSL